MAGKAGKPPHYGGLGKLQQGGDHAGFLPKHETPRAGNNRQQKNQKKVKRQFLHQRQTHIIFSLDLIAKRSGTPATPFFVPYKNG
jgi:hypothetical protein